MKTRRWLLVIVLAAIAALPLRHVRPMPYRWNSWKQGGFLVWEHFFVGVYRGGDFWELTVGVAPYRTRPPAL